MSRIMLRAAIASGLVLAAAAPAVASAAPAASQSKLVRSYDVNVKSGILAKGNTVEAKVVVRNPDSSVSNWWSQGTIAKVVRKGVNGKYEMPYNSQGYRCTPSVTGKTASFTCKLRGADVPTTVKVTFAARYKG